MVELSFQAKQRLAFLEFNQVVKDVSLTCRIFKISRQTFYQWQKRYDPDDLASLEDHPKAPLNKRGPSLSWEKEQELKRFRKSHLKQGKIKLAIMYEKEKGERVSSWQFQRVIEKHQLYLDKTKAAKTRTKKAKNRGKKKIKIHEVNPRDYLTDKKPFFFCLDAIVLYLPWGIKRYILTAIDHFHKVGYARCYKSKSSLSAFDFLLRLNLLTEGKIAAILSDNGGEWKKYFEAACQRLKITHIFTRFRTPKDNSVNERFNRTLKEEFMELNEFFEEHLAQDTLTQANQTLTDWLIFYNFQRPHQSLSYQTPMEYTCQRVSAMYPSSTVVCKKNKGYDKNNEEKDERFYFRRKEDSKRIHHD